MPQTKHGYTLVELLIVITLTALLITAGISAYSKAADIQASKSATETILTTLTSAQKAATSGKNDCTGAYLGEIITTTSGSSAMTITSSCQGGGGVTREVSLNTFTFATTTNITFRPLNQGVDTGLADFQYLDYTNSSETYRIQIDRTGAIKPQGKISQ